MSIPPNISLAVAVVVAVTCNIKSTAKYGGILKNPITAFKDDACPYFRLRTEF
jgi:hypothetical protein